MIDKCVASTRAAVADVRDGSIVAIGGFGDSGMPLALVDALLERRPRDLTIISNNAGAGRNGIAALLDAGLVRKMVCSFPRSAGSVAFERLYAEGALEVELVPQGTLSERMRAGAAGIPAFYTPTAAHTLLAEGKEERDFDGRTCILETALIPDVALIQAETADRYGNLTYHNAARNFGPVMAAAARCSIVQVSRIVRVGELDPEHIVTPGIFVDRIVRWPS